MEKITKILIVADESEPSVKAVRYGYTLAAQLGAQVALLSVDNTTENPPDTLIRPDIEAAEEQLEHLDHFLAGMKNEYSNGVDTKIFVKEGDIKDTVLQVAKHWKAQLIVAGTHSRKGISRLLRGSISESILHDSEIPVYIVPANKK
ncbi:universal stress protein [Elizabethkingia anophelis]|nr:universal stress protein [Elizabethkingia anophelis]